MGRCGGYGSEFRFRLGFGLRVQGLWSELVRVQGPAFRFRFEDLYFAFCVLCLGSGFRVREG